MFPRSLLTVTAALLACRLTSAQTYSSCNPLFTTGCPANTALGKSINIDFTQGSVNSFKPEGNPTYDSTGAHFTVDSSGDAPQLISVFYIMFGKVEISMKAAPGAGIVSSLVLQSDTLDEIDIEWLGADGNEMQSNYFGKGQVTTYNRGAFHSVPNNQNEFVTYTIDWTPTQLTWAVNGKVVRVLTPDTADANQYPQSPMQVKFGSWSGGDSSNAPGTIAWARGPTDYSQGPFTMTVRSLAVTDYSTGTQYQYGDNSGNSGSIVAVGGAVMGNSNDAGSPVATGDVPTVTAASPSIPAGIGSDQGSTLTRTGWPWVAATTTLSTSTTVYTSSPGLPEGWVINAEGKVVPANSAAPLPTLTQSLPSLSSSPPSANGVEVTGWDDRGFPTTRTVASGWQTLPRSFDEQGFLITGSPTTPRAVQPSPTTPAEALALEDVAGSSSSTVGTSSSTAASPKETPWASGGVVFGLTAFLVERLFFM